LADKYQTDESAGRVEQLQSLILAKNTGSDLPTVRPEVLKIYENLNKSKSEQGEINVIDLLSSDNVSFGDKKKWFDSQLGSAIDFLESRDLAEARQKAENPPSEIMEQKQNFPEENVPPPERDSFEPSMDELEKAKEGEPSAFFTVAPFYGGYYRGGHYNQWDVQNMEWIKTAHSLQEIENIQIEKKNAPGDFRHGSRRS